MSVIDGLLNDMQEDERKFLELYKKATQDEDDLRGLASEEQQRRNDELLNEQERLLTRQKVREKTKTKTNKSPRLSTRRSTNFLN